MIYEELLQKPFTRVHLSCEDWSLSLFSKGDHQISGETVWSEGADAEITNKINGSIQGAATLLNGGLGTSFSAPKLVNMATSMMAWERSSLMSLPLSLVWVAVNEDDDLNKIMRPLYKSVYPTVGILDFDLGTLLTPPMSYNRGNVRDTRGRISVEIGGWLKTPPIFLMESFYLGVSQEVLKTGRPVSADIQIRLKSCRIITYEEVEGMLI